MPNSLQCAEIKKRFFGKHRGVAIKSLEPMHIG
jgi:hypothetical protein